MNHKYKGNRFLTGLTVMAVLAVNFLTVGCEPQKDALRLDYAARIIPEKKEFTARTGERIRISFELANTGKKPWRARGSEAGLFSYHLLDENRQTIQYDNQRFPLPEKILPNQSLDFTVTIRSPLEAGDYILEFDLLREGIAWFKDTGSPAAEIALRVEEREWEAGTGPIDLGYGTFTRFHSGVDKINRLHTLIRITLEENETQFHGQSGTVFGFSPGKDYPQIWLRDANTIIPAVRYFYPQPHLCSWIEEHLFFQDENGSLKDWIAHSGDSGKNTTETDQEASAVQAAYKVYETIGEKWLLKDIRGETIIDRLESALKYVLNHRFSSQLGMVTGAHTADWGDVGITGEGQDAVYVDQRTQWTADIYDQAMFYQASLELTEMLEALGEPERAETWRQTAHLIRSSTNQRLWQTEKGFYRVHLHLGSFHHDFDESDMFAMGGNAVAVLSGLADENQSRRIIETALKRQKEFNISTISGTLLPPYPEGVFRHPLMSQPYVYQNGGQWDWFGGRLLLAMFEKGYSLSAKEKLLEIIRKNVRNRGFFEWDTPSGAGRGSDMYCGNAGVLSQAVIEGYFGIKLQRASLSIEPKLGRDSGKIHVYQPANDQFAAYEYRFDPENDRITLKYNSNLDKTGTVRILLPPGSPESGIRVFIDGAPKEFIIRTNHLDRFIEFNTDFRDHTAVIHLSLPYS